MNATIQVRPVRRDDFPAWRILWDGYNAFYGRSGAAALPDEVTAITLSRFFDAHEPTHALGAESAGILLGLTHFLYHRSTIQVNPTCYLQDLFTAEAASVLADPRVECGRHAAVRQGGGAFGFPRLSQALLNHHFEGP